MLEPSIRSRPRRRPWRVVAYVGLVLLAFALGVALGSALGDGALPGGTQTQVRTLDPVTVAPPPRTVTVTVRTP